MKFRLGACAAVVLLAACSGEKSGSEMAALHGSAGGDTSALVKAAPGSAKRTTHASIASAPDRGALMSYQNQGKPAKSEGAFTYYPVAMSEDHALKGMATGKMRVPMPDGSQVQLNFERHDESVDGNWTWIGRVEGGDPQQEAVITFGENAVFASIPQGEGQPPLSIQTRNGQLFAVVADPSKLKSGNSKEHTDMAIPAASGLRQAAAAQIAAAGQVSAGAPVAQGAIAMAAPPTSANTVDVAIGYTAGFRVAQGSQSIAVTRLAFLIQVGNQALTNSAVNGYLRLVGTTEVAYADNTANQTALQELTGSTGNSNVTIPASLQPLRALRDSAGADVALLVRDFQQPENQGCGIAWLIGANGATVTPANDERWGYGVVSDGDDAGTDGSSYYCANESLVHEVGHLLGSAHDQANSTSAGRYPYSYGYKTNAAGGNFFTVMAYGDEGQTPYRIFSTPALATCGGLPCGTATADNARSLGQTIPVVAAFRATKTPFNALTQGDVNGDGRSDILWYLQSAGIVNVWAMNGTSLAANFGGQVSTACTPKGQGDFNGDGKFDLIITCSAGNTIYILFSTGSGYVQQFVGNYAAGWNIVAASDVNGDGKSDVIWHSPSTGTLNVWLMDGAYLAGNFAQYVNTACTPRAFGDLNADERADITWTCTGDNSVYAWLSTGTSYTQQMVGSFGAGWSLVSGVDVTGDRRADLLWFNQGTGLMIVWAMNGATIGTSFSKPISPVCTPRGYGDYNGDGRYDISFTCIGDNSTYIWTSAGTAFSQTFVGNFAPGWSLMF